MAQLAPLTRSGVVGHYARHFASLGAPVDRLLEKAGIPPYLLDIPDTIVSLQSAYRFAELACQNLGAVHIGLDIGLARSLDHFGAYGTHLKGSYTIGDYLEKGITGYNSLTTGEYFSLTDLGSEIRFDIISPGMCGVGVYQSHLCTIAVTIASCRQFTGPEWSPGEIGLAYQSRERLPSVGMFGESRVLRGLGQSYITIPKAILGLRLPAASADRSSGELSASTKLPEDIIGIVLKQIDALSEIGPKLQIEIIAESLAMSRRSLQRAITKRGLTYSQLINERRLRRARYWLDYTKKPITEIALDLGYTDASNFSRAFRRNTGLSPRDFRDRAKRV